MLARILRWFWATEHRLREIQLDEPRFDNTKGSHARRSSQSFDSIDDWRFPPPHPAGLPHYLRQQVALRSAPGPPWPSPGGPLFFRNMRALALDVGSKTIGVAMTDESRIAAHPLTVLSRVGHSGDAAAVAVLVAEHGVGDV